MRLNRQSETSNSMYERCSNSKDCLNKSTCYKNIILEMFLKKDLKTKALYWQKNRYCKRCIKQKLSKKSHIKNWLYLVSLLASYTT